MLPLVSLATVSSGIALVSIRVCDLEGQCTRITGDASSPR